jgi:hypothetical protein
LQVVFYFLFYSAVLEMAAVRLRKAFRYPEESDGEREELDEEEQERVIELLQKQNDARNAQYSVHKNSFSIPQEMNAKLSSQVIFTALPLVAATVFVAPVFSASSKAGRLFALLGLVSLLTTGYIMKCSPLQTDRKGKKAMTIHKERIARVHAALVPGNGAVCVLLGLAYFSAGSSDGIQPVLHLIPGGKSLISLLVDIKSDHDSHACDDPTGSKCHTLC